MEQATVNRKVEGAEPSLGANILISGCGEIGIARGLGP